MTMSMTALILTMSMGMIAAMIIMTIALFDNKVGH
jgi:hypothetical protein